MKIWLGVALVILVILTFAGLLPLPGQKDNVTTHSQPAAAPGVEAPQVQAPVGPGASAPNQVGAGSAVPPGGNMQPRAGQPSGETSSYTTGSAGPDSTTQSAGPNR